MNNFASNLTMTIAGRAADAHTTSPVYNPATGAVIARVRNASDALLDEAVAAARLAFRDWRHSSQLERQNALMGLADVLEQDAPSFANLLTQEQGKPRSAAESEISGSIRWCQEIAKQEL